MTARSGEKVLVEKASVEDVPVVTVNHLSKTFGDRTILRDIHFSVYSGETLVILGRSGTGKSLTLKAIIGLLEPSAGTLSVFGENIHAMHEDERLAFRKKIGYVFQDSALFDSLSVLENVGFPLFQEKKISAADIRTQVADRLEMVGLGHCIDQYPSELSGGMRKRVGLARALIQLPQLILYDEPTSGLDPITTDVINQIILRLRLQLQVTSIVVTHDMHSAFTIADRIIMLDKGRIIIEGTPNEIQQSKNPWVQHFIAGQALDTERVHTGSFLSKNAPTTADAASTARIAARLAQVSPSQKKSGTSESSILPAVRKRSAQSSSGSYRRSQRDTPKKEAPPSDHHEYTESDWSARSKDAAPHPTLESPTNDNHQTTDTPTPQADTP